jgi:PAS domain-containing protein
MPPELIYSTPFFISAVLIFIVALFCFTRRGTRGAWYLTLTALLGGLWAAGEGALYLGLDMRVNMAIIYFQFLVVAPLPPMALLFAFSVFGYERWIGVTRVACLCILTPAVVAMAWTDPLHHLVYPRQFSIDTGPVPMLGLEYGILWRVIIGYHYVLMGLLSAVLFWRAVTSSSVYRAQACVILIAVAVVWILNGIYVAGYSPVPNMDIGPLAFILVALSMAWGFFRYNLLDVLPIAKDEIFHGLNMPILVIDESNRILEINPAAATVFAIDADRSIGGEIGKALGAHPELAVLPKESGSVAIRLSLAGQERFFEARVSTLWSQREKKLGRVIVFQDTTEHKRVEAALRESERLQGVLEMAGAVCHDLSQPVMAILGYADLVAMHMPAVDPNYPKIKKIVEQATKLSEMNQNLMRITRYETKRYMGGNIIDIAKSSQPEITD